MENLKPHIADEFNGYPNIPIDTTLETAEQLKKRVFRQALDIQIAQKRHEKNKLRQKDK